MSNTSTFPATLDSYTNPASTDTTLAVSLSAGQTKQNDSLTNVEALLGITGSAVTSSHDYFLRSGWIAAIGSWTYSSYDSTNKTGVITVPSGATSIYQAGTRIWITNNSASQYGIVTAVASTSLTVYFGTDYSLTNAAITAPYYSSAKCPLGFPGRPDKWTVSLVDTSAREQVSPVQSTWYNPGSLSISLPIGLWTVGYDLELESAKNSATQTDAYVTVSNANNSESNTSFTSRILLVAASGNLDIVTMVHRVTTVSAASATTYYLNIKTETASVNAIRIRGDYAPTYLTAICAYL